MHLLPFGYRYVMMAFFLRGNALIQAMFEGPVVLVNDPNRPRLKVIEPTKVARAIMWVSSSCHPASLDCPF